MGTDLPREQTLFSLRNSQADFMEMSDRINQWLGKHQSLCGFPASTNRLAMLIPEITKLIAGARQSNPSDLNSAAPTYALDSAKLDLLSSALNSIELQSSQNGSDPSTVAGLNAAIRKIDAIDFLDGTPIATYRTSLVNALTVPVTASSSAPSYATPPNLVQNIPEASNIEADQKKTQAHIKLITNTQQLVVWIVVGLTGFSTIFLPNLAFGTPADYIGSFLWSLGLTQTGKQLISRTHG